MSATESFSRAALCELWARGPTHRLERLRAAPCRGLRSPLATLKAIVSTRPPPSRVRAAACSGETPSSASARAAAGFKQRAVSHRAVTSSSNPASLHALASASKSPRGPARSAEPSDRLGRGSGLCWEDPHGECFGGAGASSSASGAAGTRAWRTVLMTPLQPGGASVSHRRDRRFSVACRRCPGPRRAAPDHPAPPRPWPSPGGT